nr:cell division cycle protein 123 homolog [Lytechinus pictus]
MNRQHVLNCSFSSWYSSFVERTIESEVIKLPQFFVNYLLEDGIYLPLSKAELAEQNIHHELSSKRPSFPDLQAKVEKVINQLGGAVFPKLNWSAPRDASWIVCGNSLKCNTFNDIILLLKSSNFISHDLTKPFELCNEAEQGGQVQYELVLRRWIEIPPSMEFRVFVANQDVIAISQRDCQSFFPCVPPLEDDITFDIINLHDRYIAGTFKERHYVVDVFRKDKAEFLIVDFNPFNEVTDSLLFTWNELYRMRDNDEECQLRCIREEAGVQPSPYLAYSMPSDFLDLSTGADANKLVNFLKMEVQRQDDCSSDDDAR